MWWRWKYWPSVYKANVQTHNQTPFTKHKKDKTMMSDNFEVGEENQMALGTTSTNVKWPFQHDCIKHEVVDVHRRSSERWVKKQMFFLFLKMTARLALIPWLVLCRALWSCIAIWTFNLLVPVEIHYMKKNPGMFSSKTLISFWRKKERHEHLEWHGVSKLSGFFYSGRELIF